EQFLEPLRGLSKVDGCQLAVSHLPAFHSAKLVARFAAHDGLALRRGLIPAVELLNLHALKMGGLPKVWRL
ncbi:MAG: urease accessory protein UreD, partial [Notoacmeibacter sp.]